MDFAASFCPTKFHKTDFKPTWKFMRDQLMRTMTSKGKNKKREKLLRTGARSNAYTDFHHTVFHIHSPTSVQELSTKRLTSDQRNFAECCFLGSIRENPIREA